MNKFLIILNTINGFIFIVLGLVWIISPYDAGANFGILVIPEGLGRSSLIGDVGSYFFCILYSKKYLVLCSCNAFKCYSNISNHIVGSA